MTAGIMLVSVSTPTLAEQGWLYLGVLLESIVYHSTEQYPVADLEDPLWAISHVSPVFPCSPGPG